MDSNGPEEMSGCYRESRACQSAFHRNGLYPIVSEGARFPGTVEGMVAGTMGAASTFSRVQLDRLKFLY